MGMDEPKTPFYRYCLVPKCTNNIKSTPDKVFFFVPKDAKVRSQWCKMMRREKLKTTSTFHCCEDHFNVEEDTQNYIQHSIMREQGVKLPIKLKKGIVPHIFKCQNRNCSPPLTRTFSIKRQRLALINEIVSDFAIKSSNVSGSPHSSNYEAGLVTTNIKYHDNEVGTSAAITECNDFKIGSSTWGEARNSNALIERHNDKAGHSTTLTEYQDSEVVKEEAECAYSECSIKKEAECSYSECSVKEEAECSFSECSVKEEAECSYSECSVKEEAECAYWDGSVKEECGRGFEARGVSSAAALAGLYADHAVKDELVLGPESPHRPDVAV